MTDLSYKWNTPVGTLHSFTNEAKGYGELYIEPMSGLWFAEIRMGELEDIHISCCGTGATGREAVGQALARARWITSRLTDPDLDPGLDDGPGDDVCDNQTNEEPT